MSYPLTLEIDNVRSELRIAVDANRGLSLIEVAILVERLGPLARLAQSIERELEVHRLGEAGQAAREIINHLATQQFEGLVRDPDGKVVRPDFGRKS